MSQEAEELADPGTYGCYMCVPGEVTVYVHTQVLHWGVLLENIAVYRGRAAVTYRSQVKK